MAIRVLVLATHLSRTQAGAAHATIDLCNALDAAPWAEVTVYAQSCDSDVLAPGIPVVRGAAWAHLRFFWRFPSLYAVRRARAELRARPLPVADVCYTQSTVLGLAYRSLFPGTPVVSHTGAVLVDREFLEESENPGPSERIEARLLNRMEQRAYASSVWKHVVSTRLVARQRESYYHLPLGFFEIRPLGVDVRRFDPGSQYPDIRSQLGIAPDACVVVTVCRLVPWKNIDLLLRAIAATDRLELIVVGQGPDDDRLRETARQLGIDSRVYFVGHSDPAAYLAASDIFVLPSLIESFGMVYAEAMLMGLPCIGLRNDPPRVLSSAEDVIPEGVAGYSVSTMEELRERLKTLAADATLRRRMGMAAHELAAREYTTARYIEFLRDLIEREGWGMTASLGRMDARNPL